jgi:hypothetical protein
MYFIKVQLQSRPPRPWRDFREVAQLKPVSASSKWLMYAGINVAFTTVLLVGAAVNGGSLAELPYVALLFAICTSPLPFVGRINDPYAMLGAAMLVYFFQFGGFDAASMLGPSRPSSNEDSVSRTEIVLWLGAAAQVLSFLLTVQLVKKRRAHGAVKDWPKALLLPVGLILWATGIAATLYHDFVVQIENNSVTAIAGLAKLGVWNTTGLILVENYAGPLGIIILAYWWATSRSRAGTPLILTVCLAQFIVGWVVDTKEVAISALVIALATRLIAEGRIPWRWFLGAAVGIALAFPLLSAKRVVMSEEMHLTRLEALPRTFEILARTLQENDDIRAGKYGEQRSASFLERMSMKGNVDLIIKGTESAHPYKLGSTFEPLLYVLFPRILWSEKPAGNAALQLNREFHISADPDTFISPSHLGEWYWNFGIAGVALGMALAGALLAFIFARFDLSEEVSVTRVLVTMVTLYLLVLRSEGQIELQYVVWIRSVLLIGILHFTLARRVDRHQEGHTVSPQAILPRFPNLIR